jgi:hypothetical protein
MEKVYIVINNYTSEIEIVFKNKDRANGYIEDRLKDGEDCFLTECDYSSD